MHVCGYHFDGRDSMVHVCGEQDAHVGKHRCVFDDCSEEVYARK